MRAVLAGLLLVSILPSATAQDPLELLQAPFRDVAARSAASIVRLAPEGQVTALIGTPIGNGRMRRPPSAGVALASEWILTAGLRPGSRRFDVATGDGKLLKGTVVARATDPALALVRVPGARLRPLPIGKACDRCVGSWVLLMGNAFGTSSAGGPSATLGLLSARVEREGKPTTLVVSAAVNPGDTGGGLLDLSGRVLGIVTGRRPIGDLAEAIPVEEALAKLGEVEGFEPVLGEAPKGDRPDEILSRHLCRLAKDLRPSVVSLIVERTAAAERTRGRPVVRAGRTERERTLIDRFPVRDRAVTGFLIDGDGTIVTAYVNLADAKGRLEDGEGRSLLRSVRAVLADGRVLPASLVGAHEGKGVAILKVETEGLFPAALGRGRELAIGRWLLTLGHPFGEEKGATPIVGFGIVSDRSTFPERYGAFLTDAPINTANVGGPVVDMTGRVVGIASVYVSPQDGSMPHGLNSGIGLVIPIEDVMTLLPRIEAEGVVRFRPGYLGVFLDQTASFDGVRVSSVVGGTGAAAGGVRSGDRIRAINGTDVGDGSALRQILYSLAPGTKVVLTVERGSEVLSLEVVLGLRPEFRD